MVSSASSRSVRGTILQRWPILAAIFLDTALLMGLVPLLPELESGGGLSAATIGILLGAYSLTAVFLCLPLGLASDRRQARPIFLAGVLGTLVAAVIPALLPSAFGFGVGRLLQGISSASLWTAGLVLMCVHLGPERRSLAVAALFSAASMGELAGPLVSGIIAERSQIAVFFWAVAGGQVLLLVWLLVRGGRHLETGTGNAGSAAKNTAQDRRVSNILLKGLLSFILGVFFTLMLFLAPFKLDEDLGFGPIAIGQAFVGWNLSMAAAQLGAGRWAEKQDNRRPIAAGMLILAAGLVWLARAHEPAFVLAAFYLCAVGIGLASTVATAQLAETWEQVRPAGTGLGTAIGVTNTIWSLGFLSGNVAGGQLLGRLPLVHILTWMGALLLPFLAGLVLPGSAFKRLEKENDDA